MEIEEAKLSFETGFSITQAALKSVRMTKAGQPLECWNYRGNCYAAHKPLPLPFSLAFCSVPSVVDSFWAKPMMGIPLLSWRVSSFHAKGNQALGKGKESSRSRLKTTLFP